MKFVMYPAVEEGRLTAIQRAAGEMHVVNAATLEEALPQMAGADAFFGKLTPELLAAADHLRWVQSPTASLEHYLFPELVEHPLLLTNMRGLFSDVIADQVFGYIICLARNLHVYVRQQLERRWAPVGGEESRVGFTSGPGQVSAMDRAHKHLADQTLCVVGLGAIGSEVARRAKAFGMRIVAMDSRDLEKPDCVERVVGAEQLHSVLAEADYVVIAAPHTPHTTGLFGAEQFRVMKNEAYLINIGRGAIVSLDALDAALETGDIAGAALDVFEIEPLPSEHPLWGRENVMITPHVAGASTLIPQRHLEVLLENIRRFVAGKPLANVVDKTLWF